MNKNEKAIQESLKYIHWCGKKIKPKRGPEIEDLKVKSVNAGADSNVYVLLEAGATYKGMIEIKRFQDEYEFID